MSGNRERHMFAGGNTYLGFFSYFDHILPQERADSIYVIKGGPGTGKSSFMKRIAEGMLGRGYTVEFVHCSSDSDSLDAIVIKELETAVLDGTAPHVTDPRLPGVVDRILDFGSFWNEEGIKQHRDEIIETSGEISRLFVRAYRLLHAAHDIREDSASVYARALDESKLARLVSDLERKLFSGRECPERPGRERSLFASAITPSGLVNFLDSLLNVGTVYVIKGDLGNGGERIIERLRDKAVWSGYDVECFYCAFDPQKPEHLLIPDLDAAITCSNSYHSLKGPVAETFDMADLVDRGYVERYRKDLEENSAVFEAMLNTAISSIRRAKEAHDRLERCYIPYMDFKAVEECCEKILERLASGEGRERG